MNHGIHASGRPEPAQVAARWQAKEEWKKKPGNRFTPDELAKLTASDFARVRFTSAHSTKAVIAI